ncbi:uncharacterized protein LOC135687737 [Rhopilema esculentum]|uniref:uncharacterized protein LOC135687737 n=1 Tax=Rhopilema esculentum TaxID=499914 RepID=UPI0031DE0CE5
MSIIIIPCCFCVTCNYIFLKSEENNGLQDMLEDINETELAPEGTSLIEDRSGENVDNGSTEAADAILNVLLNSPGDFERKQPPEAIRSNFMCTFNADIIPMDHAKADGNGAYIQTGCPKKFYHINNDNGWSCIAAKKTDDTYYINKRIGTKYEKVHVHASEVYLLTRIYRQNKNNPSFLQMFATVRRADCKDPNPFYYMSYRWNNSGRISDQEFVVSRHGNAKKPHTSLYVRQNIATKRKAEEMLKDGASCAKVYRDLVKEAKTPHEEPPNPKYIYNIKSSFMPPKQKSFSTHGIPECEGLVRQMRKEDCKVRSVVLLPEQYVSFNANSRMLEDINRFCVHGNSILLVDTTFQLCDGLWLTDSGFEYEALINEKGGHPMFPGPYMWHFRKGQDSYRRFALEMTFQNPNLFEIKKIGHDLDNAVAFGLKDVLRRADNLYCTQHLQKADERHLREMGANKRTIERIMADIYGSQHGCVEELGLADASDDEDFGVKLTSLKSVWDELLPNFHLWFVKNRSEKFKGNLLMSARSRLNIKGRFYTNGLESGHRLQKKFMSDEGRKPSDVTEVNTFLSQFVDEFHSEAARALRGIGRYRLAPGYESFYVDPSKWNQWSVKRRQQHIDAFFAFMPSQSQCYEKPASAGLKTAPRVKRRVEKEEPIIFVDRTLTLPVMSKDKVTPIKLAKVGEDQVQKTANSTWTVVSQQKRGKDSSPIDPLNPDRKVAKVFQLVHRCDQKNCPASVKRCQSCKRAFTSSDLVIVKTEGTREWTTANGKQRSSTGNIYVHYLRSCLLDYQQNFEFSIITVSKQTLQLLPENAKARLESQGCVIED